MDEWEIDKPLGQCCGTGKKIEPGQEYFAALVETPEGLQRRDFCADYWQQQKPDVFCYWKTKLPDQEKINFRFVLTLILMRKRLLKYDSSRTEDDKEIWRLRIVGDKEFVEVVNPHLDEGQIEQLSSQLSEILQVDL